jgi:hypothetical protein
MTALGETQMYDAGSYYRSRYIQKDAPHQILGISPDKYQRSQVWSSAPDQMVSGSLPEYPAGRWSDGTRSSCTPQPIFSKGCTRPWAS